MHVQQLYSAMGYIAFSSGNLGQEQAALKTSGLQVNLTIHTFEPLRER